MNNGTRDCRKLRRIWSLRAGLLAIMVGIAVFAAACGGSTNSAASNTSPGSNTSSSANASSSSNASSGSDGSSGSGSSTTGESSLYQKEVAYAQCVRAHGDPSFPDPNAQGIFVVKNTDGKAQQPELEAAEQACRSLLPSGISQPQGQQQLLNDMLKFAACMRSHGVSNYPDPTDQNGQPSMNTAGSGLDIQSPQFKAAQQACNSDLPAPSGLGSGS